MKIFVFDAKVLLLFDMDKFFYEKKRFFNKICRFFCF